MERDLAEAFDLYQRAATQGYAFAQRNLANLYRYGVGVEKDYDKALRWYRSAARQGDSQAAAAVRALQPLVE